MSKNYLLQKPPNAIQEIRKIYNLNEPGRLEDAIQILKKWIEQENHILKKDFNNRYLERALIVGKGSIERAKKKIDAFSTARTLMPSFFTINESKMEFEKLLKAMNGILLPRLTEDFYRFAIVKAENQKFNKKHIFMLMQYSIMFLEYMCEHDYSNGLIFLLDFQDLNLFDFVSSLSLTDLQMFASISLKGYGSRIKELHIISQSKAVDLLINIMKQFFSHKIENNIYVYKNREEMLGKDFYFRDILPKEYGGKERPTQMITKDWLDEIFSKENLDTFKLMSKAGTEEKLRLSSKFNEDYMGIPGSFRNLRVD